MCKTWLLSYEQLLWYVYQYSSGLLYCHGRIVWLPSARKMTLTDMNKIGHNQSRTKHGKAWTECMIRGTKLSLVSISAPFHNNDPEAAFIGVTHTVLSGIAASQSTVRFHKNISLTVTTRCYLWLCWHFICWSISTGTLTLSDVLNILLIKRKVFTPSKWEHGLYVFFWPFSQFTPDDSYVMLCSSPGFSVWIVNWTYYHRTFLCETFFNNENHAWFGIGLPFY